MQDVTQQLFFITDLEKIIGRNRLTIRRWWLGGKFPKPIKLNGSTLMWHVETINEWINQTVKQ
ncbi:MAG: AlpA family phage regulatory protein [Legionellales bacterium]|nr:AlpA family phage regulatory protein [Legionellales bacterium]